MAHSHSAQQDHLQAMYKRWAKANNQPVLFKDDCGCTECKEGKACGCGVPSPRQVASMQSYAPGGDCGCGPYKNLRYRPGGDVTATPSSSGVGPQPNANTPECPFQWNAFGYGVAGAFVLGFILKEISEGILFSKLRT